MKINDSCNEDKNNSQKDDLQNQSSIRFLVLILACLLMFGNNYAFDNPQALQRQLTQDMKISISRYNLLYTAFAFPNIFLTLVGGFFIDFLGVRIAIIGFSSFIVVSQSIISVGALFNNYWIMLAGRILFGCASENLLIAQTTIIGKWFRGKELSTAIGYIMTMPELASAANSFVTPMIYDKFNGLEYPLFFSVILCFLSFLCGIILCILDKKHDQKEQQFVFKANSVKSENVEKVSFKDIRNLNGIFWILILICTLTIGSYVPFLDDANDYIQEKFEFSYLQAGRILTITYLAAAITSPFLGPYIDKFGKRRLFIVLTCVLFAISQFLFGYLKPGQEDHPNWWSLLPLITLGMSYSMYCCILIPSVQYVVSQKVIGTAFGLLGMFTSTSMAVFPIIAAYIVETATNKQNGYSNVGYFYCGISILGLLFTFSLYYFDQQNSIILDFVNPENPTDQELNKLKNIKQNQNEQLGLFQDIDDDLLKDEFDNENEFDINQWDKTSRFLVPIKGFSTPKLFANHITLEKSNSFVN